MQQDSSTVAWSAAAFIRESHIEPADVARFLRLEAPAFHRCMTRDQFTRDHRSKLARVMTVLNRAERVLGGRAQAIRWLIGSNRALNFSSPLVLLESKSGLERVHGVLLRIEIGGFA